MFSAIYLIVPFVIIVITIVIKLDWFKNFFTSKKSISKDIKSENVYENIPKQIENKDEVFAVNDNGNFDLMDMNGKILNIGYGPNPKVYINLLDQAEKDTDKKDTENGVSFISKVGDTKRYVIGGRNYDVNFTKLM